MHVLSTIILAAAAAARVSALVVTNMPGHSRPSTFNLTNINVAKVIDTYPVMEARDESTLDATGPEHEIEARDETAIGDIDTGSTVKARSWSVTDEIDFEPGPQNGDNSHAQQRNEHASNTVEVAYHEIEPRRGSSTRFYNNRDQYSGSKST